MLVLCCHFRVSLRHTCTVSSIGQVMSEDLIPEKMREDHREGESLASVTVEDFRLRWWDKILQTTALKTDGRSAQ